MHPLFCINKFGYFIICKINLSSFSYYHYFYMINYPDLFLKYDQLLVFIRNEWRISIFLFVVLLLHVEVDEVGIKLGSVLSIP